MQIALSMRMPPVHVSPGSLARAGMQHTHTQTRTQHTRTSLLWSCTGNAAIAAGWLVWVLLLWHAMSSAQSYNPLKILGLEAGEWRAPCTHERARTHASARTPNRPDKCPAHTHTHTRTHAHTHRRD
jgi:hypothetical protein